LPDGSAAVIGTIVSFGVLGCSFRLTDAGAASSHTVSAMGTGAALFKTARLKR
jgi:hypothetical protein